jgi:hypothetical protein
MAQWILKANGNVVPRCSSRPLKVDEIHSVQEQQKRKIFDGLIERSHGASINPPIISDDENDPNNEFEEYEDDDEPACIASNIEDTVDANGKLLNQQPVYDKILYSEVSLQMGEDMTVGKVTKRAIGPDGTVAGTYDKNPYLNSMIYKVEFPYQPDGTTKSLPSPNGSTCCYSTSHLSIGHNYWVHSGLQHYYFWPRTVVPTLVARLLRMSPRDPGHNTTGLRRPCLRGGPQIFPSRRLRNVDDPTACSSHTIFFM